MLVYAALFVGALLFALIIRLGRSFFYALAKHSVSLLDQLLTDLDELEKAKLVEKGTSRLVISLLKVLLVFGLAIGIGIVPVVVYALFSGEGIEELRFGSFYALVAMSLGATIPFLIPFGKKGNYSELSQLLHRIALDNYTLSNILFKKEIKGLSKKNITRRNDFVIVSGLARAGTTSLMNDLSKVEGFVSLSYANMPFLMCPNLWAKIYKPRTTELKERSHQDGIQIGLNSNEALEEYFFKIKAGDAYIGDSHLTDYELSEADYEDYLDYQATIRSNNDKVYLAKNNNFLLRYRSVRKWNDEFVMVILYREPLAHAASLMEKHHHYQKLQEEDPFVLEYMNWLGHHEFGGNHKPMVFGEEGMDLSGDRNALDYWLNTWIHFYQYVLTIDHPNTLLVNYDTYCEDPRGTLIKILSKTKMNTRPVGEFAAFKNSRKPAGAYSEEVYQAALEVYGELNKVEKAHAF